MVLRNPRATPWAVIIRTFSAESPPKFKDDNLHVNFNYRKSCIKDVDRQFWLHSFQLPKIVHKRC